MHNKLTPFGHVWRHALIWLALAFTFFPVVWVVSASFDGSNTLVQQSVVPIAPTLDNYKMLTQEPRYPFFTWMWNSIKVSGIERRHFRVVVCFGGVRVFPFSLPRAAGRLVLAHFGADLSASVGDGVHLLAAAFHRAVRAGLGPQHPRRAHHGVFGRRHRHQHVAHERLLRHDSAGAGGIGVYRRRVAVSQRLRASCCRWCGRF